MPPAATQLAVSGATQRDWFGHTVHRQFRTMIVQTENGRYRLRLKFSALDCDKIENWIRVSEPPPFGLTLTNTEFQTDIGAALDSFKPECVIFDPWNAAARDDRQRDYVETFDALRNLLPTGPDKPALGIVAHTRKPQPNEKRTGGTGLSICLVDPTFSPVCPAASSSWRAGARMRRMTQSSFLTRKTRRARMHQDRSGIEN